MLKIIFSVFSFALCFHFLGERSASAAPLSPPTSTPLHSNWTCDGLVEQNRFVTSIRSDLTDTTNPLYSSTLLINNISIPSVGVHCAVSTRPGTTYIRCAHEAGHVRFEFYPLVETTTGALKVMQLIVWTGITPRQASLSHCLEIP